MPTRALEFFHRDVWEPARRDVFPEGSTLRRVRRHDLRHSAITAWVNAGVMLKTAQQWSGHRQMSVLLSSSQDGRNDHGRREQQGADDDNQ